MAYDKTKKDAAIVPRTKLPCINTKKQNLNRPSF